MEDVREQLEADLTVDGEAAAATTPATTDAPRITLVPVGIVRRRAGGRKVAYLRATLVIRPEREAGMADWPSYVDGLIASKPITLWIGDGAGGDAGSAASTAKAYRAVNLLAGDTSGASDRSRLWKELLFPRVPQHHNRHLGLVMDQAPRTAAYARDASAWAGRALAARMDTPLNAFRIQPRPSGTSAAAASTDAGAVSTVSAGLGQLDEILREAGRLEYVRGVRAFGDRLTRSARHDGRIAAQARPLADALGRAFPDHVPATETLLGTTQLLRFRVSPAMPAGTAAASSADDLRREHAKGVIGSHGLAVAKALASGSEKRNKSKGFGRELPPGPIEDRISTELSGAIDRVWSTGGVAAKAVRDPTAHAVAAADTPRSWTAKVTHLLREASNPGARAAASVAGQSAAADMLARYLLAHRPEPQFAPGFDLAGGEISSITRHVLLRSIQDVESKRVYGLLAYPAVARVLRLVVDVEIPLDAPELAQRIGAGAGPAKTFWMAATFGEALTDARLWTPCRLDGDSCLAMSRAEVALPADASGPHWRGMANLAEQTDGAPRYTLTSRHVTAAVEQLIHKSRGADAASRSGGSAAGDADATGRSVGIMLIDNGRDQAVQREIAAADAQRTSLDASKATPIFIEDLSVGYRIDTCVSARDRPDRAATWRSLMHRQIRFGAVRDPRGAIDVEAMIRQTLRHCAPPGSDGDPDVASFRQALDEASVRPATRQVRSADGAEPGSDIDLGQLVPQEGVFQWHGDPLGLTCGTEAATGQGGDAPTGTTDTRSDLTLPVTFGPATGDVRLPPRLELNREYRFRARHALLGGGGLDAEEADRITGSPGAALASAAHTHRRHERVSAPHMAMLASARRSGPGENVSTMVIRSSDTSGSGDVCRRVVWAPAMPMADAAAHPDPARPGERILDRKPRAGRRPLGGLVNVMLDPATGGLPVDRGNGPVFPSHSDPHHDRGGEGLFVVRRSSPEELRTRSAHHYPDPAVDALMVELEPSTPGSPLKTLRVPIYDRAYRQDVDGEVAPEGWRRCEYPFAMPLLIETVSGRDADTAEGVVEAGFGAAGAEVGTLDKDGTFNRLGRDRTPPAGSVTVRRLRILLPPGCEARLRFWGLVPTERRTWFDGYSAALADIRRSLAAQLQNARLAANLDALLEEAPLPNLAEIADTSVVHAVRRPDAPSLPVAGPSLKRLNYSAREWSDSIGNPKEETTQREWAHRHLGTATTWVDGSMTVDGPDTSEVALSVAWIAADDMPGKRMTIDARGVPTFPMSGERIVPIPLARPSVATRKVSIGLLTDGVKARGIMLPLPDSRAYRLKIRPAAKSTFIRYFTDGDKEERFTARGEARELWALATRRPDSMGALEILPVFVWEEVGHDTLVRTMTVRLSWRRSRPAGQPGASLQDTTQLWYSSGWQEKLAMVFDRGQPLGPVGRHVTQWGADPIRESRARPDRETPRASFAATRGAMPVDDQWLPYPGTSDDAETPPDADKFAARVDLLALDPRYDAQQDAWYADIRVDAPTMANMWVRLGLARYQEHALTDRDDPRRDLHVSRPTTVQFELKPKRTVTVKALPRDAVSRRWPVLVQVRGALGSVNGPPRLDDGSALDPPRPGLGTFFTVEVRRNRAQLLGVGDSVNETIHRIITDPGATPDGDILCSVVIELDERPWGGLHSVMVTERDRMLSANEDAGVTIEESGPTFMAELTVRPPRA